MTKASGNFVAVAGIVAMFAGTSQAQDTEQDLVELAALCGGEVCVCEPIPPTEGAAITVSITDVEGPEAICPPGYALVVDTEPAAIPASPS